MNQDEFERQMAKHDRNIKWSFRALIACIILYGAASIAEFCHKAGLF